VILRSEEAACPAWTGRPTCTTAPIKQPRITSGTIAQPAIRRVLCVRPMIQPHLFGKHFIDPETYFPLSSQKLYTDWGVRGTLFFESSQF
jgi:hypothetical protein